MTGRWRLAASTAAVVLLLTGCGAGSGRALRDAVADLTASANGRDADGVRRDGQTVLDRLDAAQRDEAVTPEQAATIRAQVQAVQAAADLIDPEVIARLEAEREAQEAAARLEAERRAAEEAEQARIEAERQAEQEAEKAAEQEAKRAEEEAKKAQEEAKKAEEEAKKAREADESDDARGGSPSPTPTPTP